MLLHVYEFEEKEERWGSSPKVWYSNIYEEMARVRSATGSHAVSGDGGDTMGRVVYNRSPSSSFSTGTCQQPCAGGGDHLVDNDLLWRRHARGRSCGRARARRSPLASLAERAWPPPFRYFEERG